MGTNYFLHAPKCFHCGKEAEEPLHLGKSSGGWCFGLHVRPEQELYDWADMWAMIKQRIEQGWIIKNEYGEEIDDALFFTIAWDRKGRSSEPIDPHWLARNHAIQGPSGLARHALLPGHCIGHCDGPIDYIIGEFS
jgi:hypothetical protein